MTHAIAFALLLSCLFGLGCAKEPGFSHENRDRETAERDESPSAVLGQIRIGTSGDYPPFSDESAQGPEPVGFSIDVAKAWALAAGAQIEWVPFRWSELSADLEALDFDLALSGVTVRADRSIQGRFSHPLTLSGAVALVKTESELQKPADLAAPDLGIAVNAGGHLERVTRRLFPEAAVDPIPNNQAVLAQLDRPEISVVITDTLEAPIWLASRPGLRPIGPLTQDRKAGWFSAERTRLAESFDLWLLGAEADGTLARLRQRHGLPAPQTARVLPALLARIDERLSLMTEVAASKYLRGAQVADLPREAKVLESALQSLHRQAEREGRAVPDEAAALRLYRAQIEAAKWIQQAWIDQQGKDAPLLATPAQLEQARARLDQLIRPSLIYLGDRIAHLVVLATDPSPEPNRPGTAQPPSDEAVAEALARHQLPEPLLRELGASLRALGIR